MAYPILITRPQPGADHLAEALAARLGPDSPLVISPAMEIVPALEPLPDLRGYPTLVLTSSHAVAPLAGAIPAEERASKQAYCVGSATAQAARAAGFPAIDGGGDAEHLAARILADHPQPPLFYARGEHVAADLAQTLISAGIETHDVVTYRQLPARLNPAALALLSGNQPFILPLFSPRSARLVFSNAQVAAPLHIAAMSENVAQAVPHGAASRLLIAPEPSFEAMLEAIVALASGPNPVESERGPH
ncbi:MAG: uroporphyrinogen-III synthase [Roseovarius sp.]